MKASQIILILLAVSTVLSFQFGSEQLAVASEPSPVPAKPQESVNVPPEAKATTMEEVQGWRLDQ